MFNRSKISAISGVVGWLQPANPDYAVLDSTNLASTSGRYINENKFVKVESIKDSQDYRSISDSDFNDELVQLQKTAILDVMDRVFDEPDYIDRQLLYKYANNKVTQESLPDGFCGYRIYQDDTKNLAIEIKRVILEFETTGDITLVLFNSAKSTPLQSKTITITSSLQEEVLDWRLDNTDSIYKGDYYLGYFSDVATAIPYKRDYQNANVKSCITDLSIENIKVPDAISTDLFDLENIEGADETWGLNPDITTFYDYTDLILNNKFLFAKGIQMQCQIQGLQYTLASLRTNRNERESANSAALMIELEGQTEATGIKKVGIADKLTGEIIRIKKEIRRLQENYSHRGLLNITRTR